MTTYLAPAKLNLFLHITSRRADGYHNLQTLFQFLDYSDILHFQIRHDGQLFCHSNAENLPMTQDLVFRAAHLLQQYTNTPLGCEITVEKKIPMGGGLGGGSSNAATTLLALNKLWQLFLPTAKLAELGLRLGADVPIFIYGYSSWAEGVGERLTPVTLEEPWYLVIHPGCQVPTKEIFSDPDLTRDCLPITLIDYQAGRGKNVCEAVACRRYPPIQQALNWLSQYSTARMTGTGACIFARFDTPTQAQTVLENLPKQWQAFVAQGRNTSPALRGFTTIETATII